jgi:hypothetical protein
MRLVLLCVTFLCLHAQAQENAKPATIRGTVTTDTGTPLKRAQVAVSPVNRAMESQFVFTDAQGSFEIKGLERGDYFLTASKPGYLPMGWKAAKTSQPPEKLTLADGAVINDVNFTLPRAAVISGTITDEDGEPMLGVQVQVVLKSWQGAKINLAMRSWVRSDDRGNYRIYDLPPGRYYVQAGGRSIVSMALENPAASQAAYAPLFYPNANRLADAQAITVPLGGEAGGINFIMRAGATYSVSGKIVNLARGQPAANTQFMVASDELMPTVAVQSQTRADGTFRVTGLASGRYRMQIRDNANSPSTRLLEVGNSNITGMEIGVGLTATVKGRIKADGGDVPEHARVQLMPKGLGSGAYSFVEADGTFEITDVEPGTYDLRVWMPSADSTASNFFVREYAVGNQNVTESGIVVGERAGVLELAATVDYHQGTVLGVATDEDDHPLRAATIVLIGADPAKRDDRYFRRAVSDSTGAFQLRTVIPGDYVLTIWPQDEPERLLDPDVFTAVEKHAVRVSVQAGGSVTQNLKLTKELRGVAVW